MSWYEESVVYQVYPLGLCGAPYENDCASEPVSRILQLVDNGWVDHMKRLGATCLMLNPVFESVAHGYDTIDYTVVDRRLGTNDDLRRVVDACHEAGIKVLLDGVFNHVGRGFWAFRDVLERREESPYAGWFNIDFGGENEYGDHLSYETWQGVPYLVKLNHANFALNDYLPDGAPKLYCTLLLIPRPEGLPEGGTAHFTVLQLLDGYGTPWVTERDIEY